MRRRNMVAALAVGAAFAFQLGLWVSATNAQSAVALTGKVSSGAEPAMEGVVVSAKRDGLTITVSVVTDETGPEPQSEGRKRLGNGRVDGKAVTRPQRNRSGLQETQRGRRG
jgi:hypothetical protein